MLTKQKLLTFFLIFGALVFLSSNRHTHSRKKSGYFNYQGVLYADMAGYYTYLPATFNYNFKANNFPDSIDIKTGDGFELVKNTDKVRTKYTYGVALLEAPFYLLAQLFAPALGYKADGFSPPYHWAIDVAASFYLTLALALLYSFLRRRFKRQTVIAVLVCIALGTNLYYYTVDDSGMSHVYSFFLFSWFLYLLHKTDFLKHTSLTKNLLLGIIAGIIVLIRPTNILFLSCYFILEAHTLKDTTERIKRLLDIEVLIPTTLMVVVIFMPQLFYWKYISGSYLHFAYQDEGFNWLEPKMLLTWFSPNNGLFLYVPFFLLVLAGFIYLYKQNKIEGAYMVCLFLLLSYIFSCWWDWRFGCAFGARGFVEYLALLSIPAATLFAPLFDRKFIQRVLLLILITGTIFYNIKMTYSYDGCYQGNKWGMWEWDIYLDHLNNPMK